MQAQSHGGRSGCQALAGAGGAPLLCAALRTQHSEQENLQLTFTACAFRTLAVSIPIYSCLDALHLISLGAVSSGCRETVTVPYLMKETCRAPLPIHHSEGKQQQQQL